MTFLKFNFLLSVKRIECVGLQKLYRPISGCHVQSRFTVGPLMATIFQNNEILHKLSVTFLKMEDGRLTKTTK